jgi:hypothetical protein
VRGPMGGPVDRLVGWPNYWPVGGPMGGPWDSACG